MKSGVLAAAGLAAAVVLASLGWTRHRNVPQPVARDSVAFEVRRVQWLEDESRPEVVFVVLGASWCGAAEVEGFSDAVKQLWQRAKRDAEEQGRRFVATGVALDRDIRVGLRFLERLGSFDQVIVGNNWLNEGAVRYIWRDLPSTPEVPQIVVLVRERRFTDAGINLGLDSVLYRIVGASNVVARASLLGP